MDFITYRESKEAPKLVVRKDGSIHMNAGFCKKYEKMKYCLVHYCDAEGILALQFLKENEKGAFKICNATSGGKTKLVRIYRALRFFNIALYTGEVKFMKGRTDDEIHILNAINKEYNIIGLLKEHGALTKKEIRELTGLGYADIENICAIPEIELHRNKYCLVDSELKRLQSQVKEFLKNKDSPIDIADIAKETGIDITTLRVRILSDKKLYEKVPGKGYVIIIPTEEI